MCFNVDSPTSKDASCPPKTVVAGREGKITASSGIGTSMSTAFEKVSKAGLPCRANDGGDNSNLNKAATTNSSKASRKHDSGGGKRRASGSHLSREESDCDPSPAFEKESGRLKRRKGGKSFEHRGKRKRTARLANSTARVKSLEARNLELQSCNREAVFHNANLEAQIATAIQRCDEAHREHLQLTKELQDLSQHVSQFPPLTQLQPLMQSRPLTAAFHSCPIVTCAPGKDCVGKGFMAVRRGLEGVERGRVPIIQTKPGFPPINPIQGGDIPKRILLLMIICKRISELCFQITTFLLRLCIRYLIFCIHFSAVQ